MRINEFFDLTRKETRLKDGYLFLELRPQITCGDGTKLSVQASRNHYCKPRDDYGPYCLVEVGFPSSDPGEKWSEYKDGKEYKFNETVFGFIPIELVEEYIEFHGGFKSMRCLYCNGSGQVKVKEMTPVHQEKTGGE